MTFSVTNDKSEFQNRFDVDATVYVPAQGSVLTQQELLELAASVDGNDNSTIGYLSGPRFIQGAVTAKVTRVDRTTGHLDHPVFRDFSNLVMPDEILDFVCQFGFLSPSSELQTVRIGQSEYFIEPLRDWFDSIIEVALVREIIDLGHNDDAAQIERLLNGIFPPHTVAYLARWLDNGFELKLVSSEEFLEMDPVEMIQRHEVRTTAGLITITRRQEAPPSSALLQNFPIAGYLYQHAAEKISSVLRNELMFGSFSDDLLNVRLESTGLHTLVWFQLWGHLKGAGSVKRCEWCSEFFTRTRENHRFCSENCRQKSFRLGRKLSLRGGK